MEYRPLPIGISDLAEMIQKKFYSLIRHIEFKVAKDIDDIDSTTDEALRQIAEKKCDVELRNDGYKHVSCYGIDDVDLWADQCRFLS